MSMLNVDTVMVSSHISGALNNPFAGQKAEILGTMKHSKRTALGTITNVPRRNPDRACKGKASVVVHAPQPSRKGAQRESSSQPFQIYVDPSKQNSNEADIQDHVLGLHDALHSEERMEQDQPMVVSPYQSSTGDDVDGRIGNASCGKESEREYEEDILKHLKDVAKQYRPRFGYMERQPDINYNMRSILVDWLIEVSEEFSLDNRTLYLAVAYIDRFLSIMSVQRGKLQLVGATSLFIAAKFEEIYPPDASDFIYVTDDAYTQEQLLRMEQLILKTLGHNLSTPTTADFLDILLGAAGCKLEGNELKFLAMYLCELSLLDSSRFLRYLPADIAASAILLASHTLRKPICSRPMIHKCGTEIAELMRCFSDLQVAFKEAPSLMCKVVVQKYSERYMNVARLSPTIQPFGSVF